MRWQQEAILFANCLPPNTALCVAAYYPIGSAGRAGWASTVVAALAFNDVLNALGDGLRH